jgi:hypothetical protein
MESQHAPYMTEFASCWGLLTGSLLIAAPIIFFKIKEHVDVEEDLKFSDETAADVNAVAVEDRRDSTKEETVEKQVSSA